LEETALESGMLIRSFWKIKSRRTILEPCLIIAAGKGTRLAGVGDSKPLVPLMGKPLIVHVIETIRSAGVTDVYVVIGFNGEKVRNALTAAKKSLGVNIHFIQNDDWEEPNGLSVLKARGHIEGSFFLMMSDHIFDVETFKKMALDPMERHAVKLAVDLRLEDNPLVDLEDVTKVRMDPATENILEIGKTIEPYNAFDTGLFRCTPELFDALETSIRKGDASLSGGMKVLASDGRAGVMDIGDSFWIDVDNEEMMEKAETLLEQKGLV
jgi:choline kinase